MSAPMPNDRETIALPGGYWLEATGCSSSVGDEFKLKHAEHTFGFHALFCEGQARAFAAAMNGAAALHHPADEKVFVERLVAYDEAIAAHIQAPVPDMSAARQRRVASGQAVVEAYRAASRAPVGLVDGELREAIERFPKLNEYNYDHDAVCELNAWGIEVYKIAEALASSTQPVGQYVRDPYKVPEGYAADCWQDLIEKTDRTSPEDYPDYALITREELVDYIAAAPKAAAQAGDASGGVDVALKEVERLVRAYGSAEYTAGRTENPEGVLAALTLALTAIRALSPQSAPLGREDAGEVRWQDVDGVLRIDVAASQPPTDKAGAAVGGRDAVPPSSNDVRIEGLVRPDWHGKSDTNNLAYWNARIGKWQGGVPEPLEPPTTATVKSRDHGQGGGHA